MTFFLLSQNIDGDQKTASLLGKGPIPAPQPLLITAPSTGDDYDSDQGSDISDEENRPLTQGELKQRIMKGVSYYTDPGDHCHMICYASVSKKKGLKGPTPGCQCFYEKRVLFHMNHTLRIWFGLFSHNVSQ